MTGVENIGVFMREKFGSKIAWANRKECNKVRAGLSRETGCFSTQTHHYPVIPLPIGPSYF